MHLFNWVQAQWAAYQVKRVEYDRSCLRAGTTYCASVASPVKYIPSLRAIAASSETDDKLDQRKKDMCTPCFFEVSHPPVHMA